MKQILLLHKLQKKKSNRCTTDVKIHRLRGASEKEKPRKDTTMTGNMKLEKFHKGKCGFNAEEFRTSLFLEEGNKGDKRKREQNKTNTPPKKPTPHKKKRTLKGWEGLTPKILLA